MNSENGGGSGGQDIFLEQSLDRDIDIHDPLARFWRLLYNNIRRK
jgi:hypothetical protein